MEADATSTLDNELEMVDEIENIDPGKEVFLRLENIPDPIMERFILNLKQTMDRNNKNQLCVEKYGEMKYQVLPKSRVRVFQSDREKVVKRQLYQKKYNNRHDVIIKSAFLRQDEETIRKKREYAQKDNVKQNKQQRAQIRQKVLRSLKNGDPEYYKNLVDKSKEEIAELKKKVTNPVDMDMDTLEEEEAVLCLTSASETQQ
jgi:hypothetical protein